MTTSTKGTALVTGASSCIFKRDPARNRPLPPNRVSEVGSTLIADLLPFLFIIKNPSLLRSYLCSTPFVM
jgi:hypothetical protein